ncbi:hypothetical protein [Paenibacillus polymyxa]|uniref:hypothetical protein n=1 Tax=Paenibacillus polymyxa TaxID=1406 RepID=UPI0011184A05|nr:hypothetical protein [Paenibacillus polymyxa]QDA29702.1 hypothetical protein FGY93_23565 [Paenibacillus polymyxa]
MKLIFKFNDNSTINIGEIVVEDSQQSEAELFAKCLHVFANGIQNNEELNFDFVDGEPETKKYSDLSSIEIIVNESEEAR